MSRKYALIIGNTEYTDPGLAQLTAPGKDAEDFAHVLGDKNICAFDDVKVLLNQSSHVIRETIDEFFYQKKPDDLIVLYFSGHGVRDELGKLYLAVKNTNRFRLRSTAIRSDFIREAMDQSRSKRQVLILDCCNSGAFAQGTKAATGVSIGTSTAFESGYGRIILTASDSTQFAWEGNKVIGETDNSLFTHFLVQGLEGVADRDGDGKITVDELYDYTYEQVKLATPKQTPSKFSSKQQGEIILRQNIRIEDTIPVPLPNDLITAINSSLPFVREGAVRQLEELLKGRNLGLARSARQALEKIASEDDSRRVSQLAAKALEDIRHVEQLERKRDEEKRLLEEKQETERLVREKVETERIAKQKAEEERLAKAKLEEERLAKEKAEREASERKAKEEADLLAKQKAEEERIAKARVEQERRDKEKAAKEKAEQRVPGNKVKREATLKAAREFFQGRTFRTWALIGIIGICIIGFGTWGISHMTGLDDSVSTPVTQPSTSSPALSTTQTSISSPTSLPPPLQLPVLAGTTVPFVDRAISPQNADQIVELARWGKGTIEQVIYSPNGKMLAVASSLGVYLYDADNLEEVQLFNTGNWVNSVTFTPDGQTIATGSKDGTISLLRVSDGTLLQTLEGHTSSGYLSSVNSVAISPDGTILASGSSDKTIRLWRISDGVLLKTLERHVGSVYIVAFSPDGNTLASGSYDKTIHLWRVSDGASLLFIGHTFSVSSVAFSPDGSTIASGSNKTIRLWRVSDGALLQTFEGDNSYIYSLAFSPDGNTLAVGSNDTIHLWRVSDGASLQTLEGHSSYVNNVAFSSDGSTLASGSNDNTIRLWRVSDGTLLQTLEGHTSSVRSLAFSPDGITLASGSNDGTIRLRHINDSALIKTLEGYTSSGYISAVDGVAFSPDGNILAAGSNNGAIRLWRISDGTLLQIFDGQGSLLAFSPDGNIFASGSYKTIRLWRVSDGTLLQTFDGHASSISSLAFSPDGTILASSSYDKTIRLWRVSDGATLQTIKGDNSYLYSVAFSPDGNTLAGGSNDSTIRLWRVSDGTLLQTLEGHTNSVNNVVFSPDGNILASSSYRTIHLWRVSDGTLLQTFEGHDFDFLAFSPDGNILASGSGNGTIQLWGIAP